MQKSHMYKLTIIIIILTLNTQQISQQKINKLLEFKNKMETKVKIMVKELQKLYHMECPYQLQICTKKSYNLCDGTGPRICFDNFPTPKGCLNSGINLALESGARVPNIFPLNNLNIETRLFICASALIQPIFDQIQQANDSIQYSYAYIGSSTGAIRISPAFKQKRGSDGKTCVDYDPRIRPWYVSSITGPKTTVILFDISKTMTSMHPGTRFRNALLTLQILITTLNSFDHVGLVLFSKTASTIPGFENIVQANQNNKNTLLNAINNIQTADGITNYTAAIELSLNMLENYSTDCSTTNFLLLTDGYTENDDIGGYYRVIPNMVRNNLDPKRNLKLISFVYGAEQNIKYRFVDMLTDQYNGILFRFVDGIDLFTMIQKLSSYYAFISEGLAIRTQPMWSQPYEDAFGFGSIMSATLPIYDLNRTPKIIGVAAIDVLMSKFQQQQIGWEVIQNIFIKIPECQQTQLDNNTLEYLRCKARNNTITCGNLTEINQSVCNGNISMNVFYDYVVDGTEDQSKCCGPTQRQFYAILFGSLGGGVFIIFIITLYQKGFFHYLLQKRKKVRLESLDNMSQNYSDKELLDPANKYKEAQQSGIRIYHEPQFTI